MQPPEDPTELQSDYDAARRRRTTLVVLAVLALLVVVGALHAIGVLPAGS